MYGGHTVQVISMLRTCERRVPGATPWPVRVHRWDAVGGVVCAGRRCEKPAQGVSVTECGGHCAVSENVLYYTALHYSEWAHARGETHRRRSVECSPTASGSLCVPPRTRTAPAQRRRHRRPGHRNVRSPARPVGSPEIACGNKRGSYRHSSTSCCAGSCALALTAMAIARRCVAVSQCQPSAGVWTTALTRLGTRCHCSPAGGGRSAAQANARNL